MSNPTTALPDVGQHSDYRWPTLSAQEIEPGGDTPDVNRLPDQDLPELGEEVPDVANDPGAPPFTGEDVGDTGKPHRRKRPQDEPNI